MKRMIICISLFFFSTMANSNVYAITNKNNIEIDDTIYSKLVKFYGEDYLMTLSNDDYNDFQNIDLSNIKIVTPKDSRNYNFLAATEITNYKNLKIIVAENKVTVKLDWLKQPKVKNYDVMAVRFSNTEYDSIINAKYVYGNYNYKKINEVKTFDNGLGFSFKLPTEEIKSVIFDFKVNGNGIVYATYQHSTTNKISYVQSRNFYISSSGLGRVLSFKNGIEKYYDGMQGVSITV